MRIIAFGFGQAPAITDWPGLDQTAGRGGGGEQSHESGEREIMPQAQQRGGWVGGRERGVPQSRGSWGVFLGRPGRMGG
jgi:hypothetical protein